MGLLDEAGAHRVRLDQRAEGLAQAGGQPFHVCRGWRLRRDVKQPATATAAAAATATAATAAATAAAAASASTAVCIATACIAAAVCLGPSDGRDGCEGCARQVTATRPNRAGASLGLRVGLRYGLGLG